LRLHCSTFSTVTQNCSAKIANLGAFFGANPARDAQLTPYVVMAGKPVEAREGLAVEGKSGNVENDPASSAKLAAPRARFARIVSTPPRRKPPSEPAAWIGIIFLTI